MFCYVKSISATRLDLYLLVSIAFPFAFHISMFFHSLFFTCHCISFGLLLYGVLMHLHPSVDPSLTHFFGEIPGLGLALVPDIVVPEAKNMQQKLISFQIFALARV